VFHGISITFDFSLVNFHEMRCIVKIMARSYRLKRRGERQQRTRQKIVEAAIELHQAKGLAATTMSEIAERAKVGRVTVYRHFPDEAALVGACSGQYFQRHPLPDPESWASVRDAEERLRLGLRETYAYHKATEPMMTRVLAEARDLPIMIPYHDHWKRAADTLSAAWSVSDRRKTLLKAALALALNFDTWRFLVRERHLTDKQAVELMTRMTCGCQPDEK
jgi:AcrR family transcriptional regulator